MQQSPLKLKVMKHIFTFTRAEVVGLAFISSAAIASFVFSIIHFM